MEPVTECVGVFVRLRLAKCDHVGVLEWLVEAVSVKEGVIEELALGGAR